MTFSRGLAARCLLLATLVSLPLATPAQAQSSPSDYTSATRYDDAGRVVGTIAPDPDGSGSLKYLATRTTYDVRGNVIKVETGELASWQSEAVAPAAWGSAFIVHSTIESAYDALNRKLSDTVKGSDGVAVSMTQYSYDNVGRLKCTAVRMIPATYGYTASACNQAENPPSIGSPDRITKNVYDAAGQLLQVRKGVGTSLEIADVTYSYTNNGQIEYVVDANGNKAKLEYEGFDRQERWVFPSKTGPTSYNDSTPATALASAGSIASCGSTYSAVDDCEVYSYDANDNRVSLRKRDGSTLTYQYDNLNRMTVKVVPSRAGLTSGETRDVFYAYDLRGLPTKARFDSLGGPGQINTFDGIGRLTQTQDNMTGSWKSLSNQYDANSNRTRVTYPDNWYVNYQYDGLNRVKSFSDNTYGLGSVTYNNRGLRSTFNRNGVGTLGYDNVGRLNSYAQDFNGSSTTYDVTWSYTRNPASQIRTETQSNDSYSWDGHATINRSYTTNGLNQYQSAGGANFCYDANGNLTADGSSVYLYDVENRLVKIRTQTNTDCNALSYSGSLKASLGYDPLGRLYLVRGFTGGLETSHRKLIYDGDALVVEYNSAGTQLMRHLHEGAPGVDDPFASWDVTLSGYAGYRNLYADPLGSIYAHVNTTAQVTDINTYDEYGIPSASNTGRFQYTGQAWFDEIGMYYYKARIYSPTLGRFLQTDPIGYDDGFNLYRYVGNDPINGIDPTGMNCADAQEQGLSGDCVESSNFVDTKDGSDTTISSAELDGAAIEIAPSLENKREERGTTIDRQEDGSLASGHASEGERMRGGQKTAVSTNESTEAVIHSHPNNADYSITPGYRDKNFGDHRAVEQGKPNYVTRDGTVIVVERSGGHYRVRVVGGSISRRDRKEIRRVLNQFQRASRKTGR